MSDASPSVWLIGDRMTASTARRWASQHPNTRLSIRTASAAELGADTEALAGSGAWVVSCNSTSIVSPAILDAVGGRAINIHPGRLPDFAGLYTVQWAIRLGEPATAATAHFMTAEIDAGDVIYEAEVPLEPDDTGLSAWLRCQRTQMSLLTRILGDLDEGNELPRSTQDVSRRRVFRAADALGDEFPHDLDAIGIERWVRAGNYLPLSSPTYHPTLQVDEAGLVLAVDRVVPRWDARDNPAPGAVVVADSDRLVVGCANDTAVIVEEARVLRQREPAAADWSRVVERLRPERVHSPPLGG